MCQSGTESVTFVSVTLQNIYVHKGDSISQWLKSLGQMENKISLADVVKELHRNYM